MAGEISAQPASPVVDLDFARYSLLLNYDYTRRNLKKIFAHSGALDSIKAPIKANFGRMPDNSAYYPREIEDRTEAQIIANVNSRPILLPFGRENFTRQPGVKTFERFIRFLLENNVTVSFLLVPLNPIAYERLLHNQVFPDALPASEEYYRAFGAANGVKVFGGYDPARFNLRITDFFDGVHLKPGKYRLLFQGAVF
jgi:hypothetical protein